MALEAMDAFREFIVFSKHLNVTKAAGELCISPSTLSRHLAALERDIGMPLIERDGTATSLTAVGALVLKKASTLVGEYQSLLDQVARYKKNASYSLRIAYALDDRTMIDAVSLAKLRLKQDYGGLSVHPVRLRGKSPWQGLLDGDVDIIVDYNLVEGSFDPAQVTAVPLLEDSIVLALPRGTFPGRGAVRPQEVCRRYIPRPSASVDNYGDRVLAIFDGCEQRPPVRFIDAATMDEFFLHALDDDEMWLFSRRQFFNYTNVIPLSYRESCEVHELADCDTSYRRWAVYKTDTPNRLVPLFAEALSQADPERA